MTAKNVPTNAKDKATAEKRAADPVPVGTKMQQEMRDVKVETAGTDSKVDIPKDADPAAWYAELLQAGKISTKNDATENRGESPA